MNDNEHTTSIESAPAIAIEANSPQSQVARSDAPDDDYDGTTALNDPAHEAVARFFAAPRQFRQFPSAAALAEHFGVSRMTVYRWAEAVDVVRRTRWLLERSMRFGDLIACREWAGIVQAQVEAALAGDTRAAIFCQNRAWHHVPIFPNEPPAPAIGGADAIAMWHEKIDESRAEELDAAKKDPQMEQGKNGQE